MGKNWALAAVLAAAAAVLSQPANAHGDGHARKAQMRHHHHHQHCKHHHHRHAAAIWRPYDPAYTVYRVYETPRYSYRPYYYSSWTYPYSGVYLVPRPHNWGHHYYVRDYRW